jgi:hypothetical protein
MMHGQTQIKFNCCLPLPDSVHDHYHCALGTYISGFVSWCNVTDLRWTGLPLLDLEVWELMQFDFSVSIVGCDIRVDHS